jgi:hypothetical protein
VEIRFNSVAGTQVLGRVYNVAGELVVVLVNTDDPGKLVIDLKGRKYASGIYAVAIWARAPWGEVDRTVVKFVLMR